jgi:hypothetical protein
MTLSNNADGAISLGQSSLISIQKNVITGSGNGSTSTAFGFGDCNNISITSNRVTGVRNGSNEGDNSVVSYQQNVFSNISSTGISCGSDTNVTISGNQIVASGTGANAVTLGGVNGVLISNNAMQNGAVGISAGGCKNVQINGNTMSNYQFEGIEGGGNNPISLSANTITNTVVGVSLSGCTNLSITGNQIAQCQNQALYVPGNIGTETISNNKLSNCGLASTNPAAVIFVDSSGATSIPITNNNYKGNTANLQYFIWCVQPQPPAQISGNLTNTLLPNRIGF